MIGCSVTNISFFSCTQSIRPDARASSIRQTARVQDEVSLVSFACLLDRHTHILTEIQSSLGQSGLKVSQIILGAMSYGSSKWQDWVLDEEQALWVYLNLCYLKRQVHS